MKLTNNQILKKRIDLFIYKVLFDNLQIFGIILLICFGLLAHSQASADDVKDFQIEEVGIGESLQSLC